MAAMLLLLMTGHYVVQRWGGLKCHIVHTKFYENISIGLKLLGA